MGGPAVIANGHGHTFNDKNAIWADKNPTLAVLRPGVLVVDPVPRDPGSGRTDHDLVLDRRRPHMVDPDGSCPAHRTTP